MGQRRRESMSDLDEEGDMPDGKYFLRSGVELGWRP